MTKEQKQLIFIGVGIIILIIVFLSNLKGEKKKKLAPPAQNVTSATPATMAVSTPKSVPVERKGKGLDAQKKRAELPWGRDPFLSDIEKGDQISELRLQGISFGGNKVGYAFINNIIVKKGDKVGEYEVFEIFKDRVLLRKGNQSFYLVFPEE